MPYPGFLRPSRIAYLEWIQTLWYNKSRATARICPACQRLYRLGDVLPDHLASEDARSAPNAPPLPYLAKEQELSGLCEYLFSPSLFPSAVQVYHS